MSVVGDVVGDGHQPEGGRVAPTIGRRWMRDGTLNRLIVPEANYLPSRWAHSATSGRCTSVR